MEWSAAFTDSEVGNLPKMRLFEHYEDDSGLPMSGTFQKLGDAPLPTISFASG
jgi:hypothetical protein